MDIGLYRMKYPFRKIIGFMLPAFAKINPNVISLALLPLGALMAWVAYYAVKNNNSALYVLLAVLGISRMILATLDGLVAQKYGTSTVKGDILNRVAPELCDLMLIPAILLAQGLDLAALLALAIAWATPFIGMLGAPAGIAVQSVGPVGQTDRLAAIMLVSLLQALANITGLNIDLIQYLIYWLILGGLATLAIRFSRIIKAAKAMDAKTE